MYNAGDLKKGLRVEIDNTPFVIIDTQFVKPGKGQAFTRLKLKNLLSGAVIDKTCKIGEKMTPSEIEERLMLFLYIDGEQYFFMDKENFEQISIAKEKIGENWKWLIENLEVKILVHKNQAVGIELPNFAYQKVTYSEPGIKGDRVSNSTKEAKIESGALIQVPLFINEGDKIKIDTRSGVYVERAN